MMKKDIKWLRDEVNRITNEYASENIFANYTRYMISDIKDAINQLDEPEVLSQEWLDEHKVSRINNLRKMTMSDVVRVDDLENLIIPKEESEVTLNRAFEKVSETYPMTKEEVCRHLEKFVAHGGKVTYGEQEVLSQELPVVPAWFDEWWKDMTKGGGNLFHNIERFYNELYSSGTREACDYISHTGNKKKLLNIIINELDYEVEDEQKYFVSSRESVGFWFLSKNNDNEVVIGTNKDYYDRKWESLKLTEEEIKDYDSRYWAFAVKVEEMEE